MVASSSADGSTKLWDLGTGQETDEGLIEMLHLSDLSKQLLKQGGAEDQKVNGYVVSVTGKTLYIFNDDAEDGGAGAAASSANEDGAAGSADGAGKVKTAPVAFFQCSAEIQAFDVNKTFDVACANIVVGCADGQVLQLFAAVLQP